KLIEAAQQLVDSLGPNDEAAIVTFGRQIRLEQDFTTDKTRLKLVLDGMIANGGTAMFSATYRAIEELETRGGNRHAVVISDGEDNQSTHDVEQVIDLANFVDATLHTIAFDIAPEFQNVMERMAVETGGVHFFVSRPSELATVYERIADIITEPCCIAEYVSDSCEDTLRSLLLTVTHGGNSADDLQTVISPSRPEQTTLSVEVPAELTPLATGRGYVNITPPPSIALGLTLSFTLRYDQNLVDIPLLPFTLGTVAQNQVVDMVRIGPGQLRISLTGVRPPFPSTRLLGFSIEALRADSSSNVAFSISDAIIEGCPTVFTTVPDTMLICQCFRALALSIDSIPVLAADQQLLIPLRIHGGLEMGLPLEASLSLSVPASLDGVDLLPGNLFPAEQLTWRREGDRVDIRLPRPALPADTAGVLAYLRIGPNEEQGVRAFDLAVLASELWQRCCPLDGEAQALRIQQDGNCDFLLRRVEPALEVGNAPNPFTARDGGTTQVVFRIPARDDGRHFTLNVLDSRGRRIETLFSGALPEGEHRIRFEAGSLPAGVYHAVLRSGDLVVTRAMLYVR
ncbi:MAG: VWA domain-containing protein, partial [Bacteroidota bacterium]|nr:VWA domain-containing protein [Bacteroidota bacterium]